MANGRDRRSFLKEMVGLGGALMVAGRGGPFSAITTSHRNLVNILT